MSRIRQLPPDVVTKIAAGEVIERPASVVKELCENSLDAGSTRIDIDLEAGGIELIRVVDDGSGIEPDDLPLALARHATSKLRHADDLFAIGTMGFRGEALASIGGVGRVVLQSRPRGRSSGAEIRCDGGVLSPLRPWNGSPGTRVEVRHLFFNVPVRKKFLKGVTTELGHVCETVTRLALANPTVHLTLRHNGRLVYDIPATAGRLDRIGLFFGAGVRDSLYEFEAASGDLRVTGHVADPSCDRGNPKLQYFFVNGRWFRDRSVGHALQEAYRGLLMTGRYAIGFVYLTVPPEKIDVNVHPTKSEVRFQDNSQVYSLVRAAVKSRLLKANLVPRLAPPVGGTSAAPAPGDPSSQGTGYPEPSTLPPGPFSEPFPRVLSVAPTRPLEVQPLEVQPLEARPPEAPPAGASSPRAETARRTTAPWEEPAPGVASPTGPHSPAASASSGLTPSAVPATSAPPPGIATLASAPSAQTRVPDGPRTSASATLPEGSEVAAGVAPGVAPGAALQVQDTYIVLETAEGMLVIDQHALHERILFEQIRRRLRAGQLEAQRLLIPEPIELPAAQCALVLEVADTLKELGLEVSEFGGNTVLLSSYPTLLGRKPPREIFLGVVDHLVTQERPPTREVLLHQLMATLACKAAVKAGDRLTPDEIAHLLHLRQLAEDSHHCPHGRPTSLLFSRQELDRQFRRG